MDLQEVRLSERPLGHWECALGGDYGTLALLFSPILPSW